jgi:flagellar L-ring protein precursor FlgH
VIIENKTAFVPPKIENQSVKKAPGSLYEGYDNLFSDDKALNVGDIVTVKVMENISGQGSANTKTSRSNKLDMGVEPLTFLDKKLPKKESVLSVKHSSTNDFQGKGDTKRSAKLIATISARVVKVYPSGNLFIVGKKIIQINEDIQVLKISGIIKPIDIDEDNSIESSKIADMYVEYNGKGFIAKNQGPGWFERFLMRIWPF